MGSPAQVSQKQYADLERAAGLENCGSPEWLDANGLGSGLRLLLPRQGVSLLELSWR
jgi:hypothetical protein